ncbi:MAG TPA: iron uptake transporter deferrochelatase/peroxidase subunit [Candidatus Limnocylindrales bacterium]|nr:iron uptake transporter deferrochelatase/peroxidase subunit [Candidatus Limnocylindrales bacterium]
MTDRDVTDPGPPAEATVAAPRLSRRALLGVAATGSVAFVAGRASSALFPPAPPDPSRSDVAGSAAAAAAAVYPFFGGHQAGVSTPLQGHLHFAAFDLSERAVRADLVALLRDWSSAAASMTQGQPVGLLPIPGGDPDAPRDDTGEVEGLPASGLTVTIGLGPSLFERDGVDRYGIAARRPAELQRLPSFTGDALEPASSEGDLCVQVCADDPQVAVHAVRNLARIAAGRAAIRWSQLGFAGTSATEAVERTPRNLLGFKDGTNNILGANEAIVDQHVWLPPTSQPTWFAGGTYLVVRKVRMALEAWDRQPVAAQQVVIGRTKLVGGPLSGGDEFTAPDFEATSDGVPSIDRAAHVRLAHPSSNGGTRILRRGYNYVDGTDTNGRLDAGLLFISFQRSPGQFIDIQRSLAEDLLDPFIRHIGSALFAIPPGASKGGFVGETLLD